MATAGQVPGDIDSFAPPPFRREHRTVHSVSTDVQSDPEQLKHDESLKEFRELFYKRYRTVESVEQDMRKEQKTDLEWRAGGDHQWDERTRAERNEQQRPFLTINRFPQAIHQIVNSERMTKGAVQVSAVDNGADVETAEVFQGIIRHIEDKSAADSVYSTAAMWQATIGRGYIRVVTEQVDERRFEKQIRIKRVRNPFMIYCDPAAQEPDGRDIRYAFVITDMPGDQYNAKFGKDSRASLDSFQSGSDLMRDWAPEGKVRVAEYFYVVEEPDVLYQLETTDDQTEKLFQQFAPEVINDPILRSELPPDWRSELPRGLKVANSMPTVKRQVKWAMIDAEKILIGDEGRDWRKNTEGRNWDGKWIPIVQVLGDEIDMDGKLDYRGIVRDGRDAQQVYNFMVTSEMEMIQTSKTAPWVGYKGQFKGFEKKWRTANVKNHPYMEVNAVPAPGGGTLPLPQRNVQEPPIMAINAAIIQADNDFKATTRWHDASLGEYNRRIESGVAIEKRQRQDQQSNSHFPDNMNRAKKFLGDLLIDLIPKTYDTPRVLKILGVDDSPKTIEIHGGNVPMNYGQAQLPEGVEGIYDLSAGTYDTSVSVGPSYQNIRQETAEHLTMLFTRQPDLFQMFADIYFDSLDSPVATRLSNRAKRLLPVDFQDDEGQEPVPAAVAQELEQLKAQLEQAEQALQQAHEQLRVDAVKAEADAKMTEAELASRERVAAAEREVKVLKLKLDAQGALSLQKLKQSGDLALKRHTAKLDQQLEKIKSMLDTRESLTEIAAKTASQMAIDKHATKLLPPGETDETKVVI